MYMLSIHFAHQKSSPTKLYDENVRAFFVVKKKYVDHSGPSRKKKDKRGFNRENIRW